MTDRNALIRSKACLIALNRSPAATGSSGFLSGLEKQKTTDGREINDGDWFVYW